MKYIFLLLIAFSFSFQSKAQQFNLPDSIYTGKQGEFHVQGVVVDQKNGHAYFSFTNKLIKTDLNGNLIGSVIGFVGHLGDLDFGDDGKIYGSLEYKNDAIGKGIQKELGVQQLQRDGFYIAIFDPKKIVRPDMNAEKEDLLRTVYVKEAVLDYTAKVQMKGKAVEHRFACSGIDGVAFAPAIGEPDSKKKYLYVAYGVYGDTSRNDNDYQVILKYDVADWKRFAKPLTQGNLHESGPQKPLAKYFVRTGNSRYGVQNLAYDAEKGVFFAAVYKGSKKEFPNYDLFAIDAKQKPFLANVTTDDRQVQVMQLGLADLGKSHAASGVKGWNFPYGATGFWPLGDDLFYISHPKKAKDGQQEGTIFKYRWTGDATKPFVRAK